MKIGVVVMQMTVIPEVRMVDRTTKIAAAAESGIEEMRATTTIP
jgi:hypothetical protein